MLPKAQTWPPEHRQEESQIKQASFGSKNIENPHFSILSFSQFPLTLGPQPSCVGSGSPVSRIPKEPKFLRRESSSDQWNCSLKGWGRGRETLLVFFFSALLLLDPKCKCSNGKAWQWGNKLQVSDWNNEKGTTRKPESTGEPVERGLFWASRPQELCMKSCTYSCAAQADTWSSLVYQRLENWTKRPSVGQW